MKRLFPYALTLVLASLACSSDSTTGPAEPETLPLLLSDVDRTDAIDYTPTYILWSNGLEKHRQILLPPGGKIDNSDPGHWGFPEGTRIFKEFVIRGPDGSLRKVETRILWFHNGSWEMAAYVWNQSQTDAALVVNGAAVSVSVTNQDGLTFNHTVPGRTDCQSCHASSPAFILGFRELQLNHDNQLAALAARGIFTNPIPAEPDHVEASDPETAWVLGYVTANCVHCHNGTAQFDMSHDVFLQATVGQPGPYSGQILIKPGDPDASRLFNRLKNGEMPPLGVQLRDDAAVARLRAWIEALQ